MYYRYLPVSAGSYRHLPENDRLLDLIVTANWGDFGQRGDFGHAKKISGDP